jgi:hypothetical protein
MAELAMREALGKWMLEINAQRLVCWLLRCTEHQHKEQ